jgi:single-strand DNA-binding protein
MNQLKNSVRLLGNLGANPELKETSQGRKLARLNLATSESYKDAEGNKVTETQWHNLVAWGKTAEYAEKYLTKGSKIAIEGKLINRNYNDKDGNKRYVTEIVINEILNVSGKER